MKKRVISLLLIFSIVIPMNYVTYCYAADSPENNPQISINQVDSRDKLANPSLIKEGTLEHTTKPCEKKLDTNHFGMINNLKSSTQAVKNFVIKHRYKILALLTIFAGTYLAFKNYDHFLNNNPTVNNIFTSSINSAPKVDLSVDDTSTKSAVPLPEVNIKVDDKFTSSVDSSPTVSTADDTFKISADPTPEINPDDIVEMVKADDHINNIPIVMNIDNNGARPATVTIASACKNASPETSYNFNILVPHDFLDENQKILFENCDTYKNCKMNITKVSTADEFSNPFTSDNIPKAAYYRLLSPQLLNNKDKVLYLDNDLVINNDLSNLFNIDLKSNYAAGVKDVEVACDNNYYKYTYPSKYGVRTSEGYINSGVLLMNLKKMR
ncbi:MAG: hypothetical protein RUMPE_01246 [Eubacteriales bacterium SKADARSKE-1]|nr:hypothetical protein [Eubacteriales bacterium SKADARSKE-1]